MRKEWIMPECHSIPYTNRFGKPDHLEVTITRDKKGAARMGTIGRRSDGMKIGNGGVERAQELIEKGKV